MSLTMWTPTDIERIATALCLTNETADFRRGVCTLALALGVAPNNGFHLTAAPVGSWATVVREAQPQVNPDR